MKLITNLKSYLLCSLFISAALFCETAPASGLNESFETQFDSNWDQGIANIDYVADEIIIGFQHPANEINRIFSIEEVVALNTKLEKVANAVASRYNLSVLGTTPVLYSALFRINSNESPVTLSQTIANASAKVVYAEPNGIQRATVTEPSDPNYTNGDQTWYHNLIGSQRGWDTIPTREVRIAVLDSGYRFDHPESRLGISTTEDMDFVSPGFLPLCSGLLLPREGDLSNGVDDNASQPMDLNTWFPPPPAPRICLQSIPASNGGHGTKVMGTIAAAWNNGLGGVGVLGRAASNLFTLIPIRVLDIAGEGTLYDIAQGILYSAGLPVDDGSGGYVQMPPVHIANMSFGGNYYSAMEQMAVNLAWANNVLLIASAGNDGTIIPHFPSDYGAVVSVSAMDQTENIASFSNFGNTVEITAPGEDIYTSSFDFSGCPVAPFIPCIPGVPNYTFASGTSLSAPIVTAVAALYKAHFPLPQISNIELRLKLRDNAADWGTAGFDPFFGYGLVQMKPGNGTAIVTSRGAIKEYSLVDINTGMSYYYYSSSRAFNFNLIPAGDYYLLMASDEDGDNVFGETGEAIGAESVSIQNPTIVTQSTFGTFNGTYSGSHGWPDQEAEPSNDSMTTTSSKLFLNKYVQSALNTTNDEDWFELLVPVDSDYRLWTEGVNSIDCRPDLGDMDSALELYDVNGTPLYFDDNGLNQSCSEIVTFLNSGRYYLRVQASGGVGTLGHATIVHFDEN
ncbi:MAG: S8 family serine peptidase [Planctomycetes bacterium]|nr:S8 family serine peptidase [Planctomycetota bacterium]